MDAPSPSLRDLAQRLLAIEAANTSGVDPHVHEAVRVCEKLRTSLTRFAGSDGFASLLRRALALAGAEVPSLQSVTLPPNGSLIGCEAFGADGTSGATEAAIAVTAHLLGLLVTFIGDPLTLRLVREAWPNASLEK